MPEIATQWCYRYSRGGGLTAERFSSEQAAREAIRARWGMARLPKGLQLWRVPSKVVSC